MLQSARSVSTGDYRFGYQGQEQDNKMGGLGQHLNYTYRNHDSWTIRFGAVDPLAAKYPHNSTYAFSENRVIDGIELEGLEWVATINSPNLGNRFKAALQAFDIYYARNIFTTALYNRLSDFDYKQMTKSCDNCVMSGNMEASLIYDKTAPPGLTINFNVGAGGRGADDPYTQIWSQTMHFERGAILGQEDKDFPIDVRVINNPEYGDYYRNFDFIGEYGVSSTSVNIGGIIRGKGLWGSHQASSGYVNGYLKGSGFVQYSTSVALGANSSRDLFGVSRAGGGLWGIASEKKTAYGPDILAGWGNQAGGSYGGKGVFGEGGYWGSFNEYHDAAMLRPRDSKANMSGIYTGFGVGFNLHLGSDPTRAGGGSLSGAVTYSTLDSTK